MRDVGRRGRFDGEEMAFVVTIAILIALLLVAIFFFGAVFVAPLA